MTHTTEPSANQPMSASRQGGLRKYDVNTISDATRVALLANKSQDTGKRRAYGSRGGKIPPTVPVVQTEGRSRLPLRDFCLPKPRTIAVFPPAAGKTPPPAPLGESRLPTYNP